MQQQSKTANYSILKMKTHIDNLEHGLYPNSEKYLTDNTKDARFLNLETLKKFKVGLGQENFFNEETSQWDSIDVVYFPMFSPFLTDKARKSHQ